MEGKVIAKRYRITRRVATGGMGVVYEAKHVETGRRVALKLMHPGEYFDAESATWTARMRREARIAGALDTPHVVQVLDAGENEDDGTYIAMEFLRGLDLGQLLKGGKALAPDVAVRIVAQACLGTSAAHARGVLHRDIKPGNLFLSVDDLGGITVKVLDFGIAKITRDPALTRLTVTGELIGTPIYVSPEQARGLASVDVRTDVWSLGVVLYKLLCGDTPHDQSTGLTDYLVTLCTVPAPALATRAPWVPEEIARVASRALEIDPELRYPSVRAMFDDLAPLVPDLRLAERDLAARPDSKHPTSVTPPPETIALPPPPRRARTPVMGVALVLTLAVGLAAGFVFGRRDATTGVAAPTPTSSPSAAPPTPVTSSTQAAEAAEAAPPISISALPSAAPAPPLTSSAQAASATARKQPTTGAKPAPAAAKPAPSATEKPKLEFETGFE